MKLSMNEENGLKKDSILRLNKLATLDTNLAVGVIGNIGKKILHLIDRKLIEIFDIKIEKRN
ncbi:MAG: hypothetical protein U9P79_05390 [Candidatus Cloacimonadota bacterium]|nr:hypothetical protein [Candidatus Cloacimonadota bacterium]